MSEATEEQARDVLEMLQEEGLFQQFTVRAEGHGPWTHTVEVFAGPHSHPREVAIRRAIEHALRGLPTIVLVRLHEDTAAPVHRGRASTLF